MSADKRKVTTDALETLGTIINETNSGRDAIHIGVEPVIAGERLRAGEHIGIIDGKATNNAAKKLGIVDPFLTKPVNEGEMFWLLVYPRQITSLRHVWSHPDFNDESKSNHSDDYNRSKLWIESFAAGYGLEYKELMDAAKDYQTHGDYFVRGGQFEGERVPDEFWEHYEVITGEPVKNKDNFFACTEYSTRYYTQGL